MDRRLLVLALLLFGFLGAGAIYISVPSVDVDPPVVAGPKATPVRVQSPSASAAPDPRDPKAPPRGSAIEPAAYGDPLDRPVVPSNPPMANGGDWTEVRAQQAEELHQHAVKETTDFLQQAGVGEQDITEVVATVEELYAELADIRDQIEGGALDPKGGRARIKEARLQAASEVGEILDPTTAKALRAHLGRTMGGGF